MGELRADRGKAARHDARGSGSSFGRREADGWRRLGLEVKGNLGVDGFPSGALANKAHKSGGESRALRRPDAVQVGPGGHLHLSGASDTALSFTVGKNMVKVCGGRHP